MNSRTEPSWSITITKVSNGYVLYWLEQLDDGKTVRQQATVVTEDDASESGEAEAAATMLWEVLSHFGVFRGVRIITKERDE